MEALKIFTEPQVHTIALSLKILIIIPIFNSNISKLFDII